MRRETRVVLVVACIVIATGSAAPPSALLPDEGAAVAAIVRCGGAVTRDRSVPGNPVVTLSLRDCRSYRDCLPLIASLQSVRALDLTNTGLSDSDLKSLAALTRLRSIDLDRTRVTDDGIRNMQPLVALECLDVTMTGVTDRGLAELAQFPVLRRLAPSQHSTAAGIRSLGNCHRLEAIDFSGVRETAPMLHELARIPNLRELQFTCNTVDGAELKEICSLSGLRMLRLSAALTDSGLSEIGRLSQLRSLDLAVIGGGVTIAGVRELRGLGNLNELAISGRDFPARIIQPLGDAVGLRTLRLRIRDAGTALRFFHGLGGLESLSLNDADDRCMEDIAQMSHLRRLDVSGAAVTDAGLARLATLHDLRWLDITGTAVDELGMAKLASDHPELSGLRASLSGHDNALRRIAAFASMTELQLEGPNITDSAVQGLVPLKHLHRLVLAGTEVTDKAVPFFASLSELELLDVSYTQVTPNGLARLRDLLPLASIRGR